MRTQKFKDPRLVRVFFGDACHWLKSVTGDPRYTHLVLQFNMQSHGKDPSFLDACESLYEETHNPLFAWRAIRHLQGKNLPEWICNYLMSSSVRLLTFSKVNPMETTGAEHIRKSLGFRYKEDAFKPWKRLIKELACCILVFLADEDSVGKPHEVAFSELEEKVTAHGLSLKDLRLTSADTLDSYRKAMSIFIDI